MAEHIFYNNSAFNGNNVAPTVQDDNAIAPNSFPANYTPGVVGDTAIMGAVPMGSVASTVINDGNYNAFPGITSLPNGELIVVYRAGTDHVSLGATINFTVSKDGGATWSTPQVLATPPSGLENRDAEIATLSNGSVMVSFFEINDDTGDALPFVVAGTYVPAADSMTWATPVQVGTAGFFGGSGAACSSKVMQLANGTLLLPVYGDSGAALMQSTDGGQTWGNLVMTAPNPSDGSSSFSESNGVVEPDGEIILFVRCDTGTDNYSVDGVWRTVSTNDGQTWSAPAQVLGGSCVDAVTGALNAGYTGRPSPVLLPSGAIVMLNRAGTGGNGGCDNYWTSWDGGLTWTQGRLIQGGNTQEYGSLTLLSDGQIAGVSAYISTRWSQDTPYAVGDNVSNGANYYQCLTAHTSGSTFSATEQQDWRLLTAVPCGLYYQNFVDSYSLDKVPLLPGETASFLNYTSYSKGIDGVMVDFDSLPGTPTAADFNFSVGESPTPSAWAAAPAPLQIAVRPVDGIERVTIIWADNAIQNEWLQVTVKATADTGLAEPFTFYYGNLIGSVGDSAVAAAVTQTDVAAIENHPTASATLTNPYDINRDGTVNATDQALAAASAASGDTLELISPPYIQPAPLPGDANLDGKVDIEDLTILLTNFGKSGMTWSQGNFDGDPTVDLEDLTILLTHFGQSLSLPVVTLGSTNVGFVRGGSPVLVSPGLTLSDAKDEYLSSATVAIVGRPLDAGSEFLDATTTGTSITASYNPSAGVLALSGLDTLADYQQVLQSVTYVDTLASPTVGARTLYFTVADPVSLSAIASATVRVALPLPGDANLDGTVNIEDLTILLTNYGKSGMSWSQGNFDGDPTVDLEDLTILLTHFGMSVGPPVVSVGNAGPVTFVQGGTVVAVAPNLTLSDPESLTLSSATVAISGGLLDVGAELLAATTSGTNITASYSSATGILTMSGTDTLANYQRVLQSVTYVDTLAVATNLGDRTLTFTVGDGLLTSASATGAVDVAA